MVHLIISFLCVLGALFIYVITSNQELLESFGLAIFFSVIPLIFLGGANLVRVSAFSSSQAGGLGFLKYIGAILVLVVIGITFNHLVEMISSDSTWMTLYGVWLSILQIGMIVTPFLNAAQDKQARL
ncbi:MAG: hypothetical protein EA412_06755 [Chitinophagaceae bacterium]|nr:MAG: hypothetical protein EA412_06755 [Chitinophagaceae bacterium]